MSMNYDKYNCFAASRQGRVLTLTMDRPDDLNIVNKDLHDELGSIFYDVQLDEEADVVVLTGAGRMFSAGGDLAMMKRIADGSDEPMLLLVDAKRIIYSLLDLEKPIIAAVNGHAMGLGANIALMCDTIFMSSEAKIADTHVKAGVVAGDGGCVIWPQLIGYAKAKEFLMTGDPLGAEEAERIGLINHVSAPGETLADAQAFAQRLANGATAAIRWTKVSANIGLKQLAHSIMDTSLAYEWLTFQAHDHKEAVNAFLEKREPNFTDT
ncbi:MAG: enoyl-CoA hydratase-related protein [Alphaproteobacteria bacterium]|nr:enoyl-CoA hydratase-related protein [Alphaproteobacteria bacterium]MDP6833289.1 enoyl-CoA hydratase-related protein [Alphaproteobacteria bacterium]MDP6873071.1 enoyl-CoA hydratase-related protein [Alphaproteobacteria bacterium]